MKRDEVKCFGYSDISESNELRSSDASVDFSPMNGEGPTWNILVFSMFVATAARWFSRVAVRPLVHLTRPITKLAFTLIRPVW